MHHKLDVNVHNGINEGLIKWCLPEGNTLPEAFEEVKKQLWLAGPLVSVSLLQYSLQVISIIFVGHLGVLHLSGASMATSFASVTGFSVLLGLGSALETLCGLAYGAQQYTMLGIHTQRGMLILLVVSIPLALIWYNTSNILIALHQDHQISMEAGKFNRWMLPSLFAYAILQCLNKFLQAQNIVFPMMVCSGITACLHILVCWLLVFRFELGSKGAAIANAFSNWVNVLLLAIYIKFFPTCKETWTGLSKEALHDIVSFVKLAVPTATMICLEYWAFEMVVLLSGLLPNPKLQTSVLSVSLNTCWMVYMVSVGLGGAINTRVSNELGAGSARGARLALRVMIIIAISQGTVIAVVTILVRNVWGKLFSNDKEVIRHVARMMPLLAVSDFLDGFQCVLSVPTAVLLAFVFHMGGQGLWMGIICGLSVQVSALVTIVVFTNWDKEARKAIGIVNDLLSKALILC